MAHRILYDAECRFCRWSLGWILRWDRGRALEPMALQDPRAPALLPGMDAESRLATWHLVAPHGELSSGGAAAAPLFRLLPAGRVLASLAT
ncbi:MAG: thiol-disulfide oxidoreductase DCC family protein, partial [Solirubrobacterales bacterium]